MPISHSDPLSALQAQNVAVAVWKVHRREEKIPFYWLKAARTVAQKRTLEKPTIMPSWCAPWLSTRMGRLLKELPEPAQTKLLQAMHDEDTHAEQNAAVSPGAWVSGDAFLGGFAGCVTCSALNEWQRAVTHSSFAGHTAVGRWADGKALKWCALAKWALSHYNASPPPNNAPHPHVVSTRAVVVKPWTGKTCLWVDLTPTHAPTHRLSARYITFLTGGR